MLRRSGMRHGARTMIAVLALSVAPLLALLPPAAASQDDAGSGADAGGSFAEAMLVERLGRFSGVLTEGDSDWFRFDVPQGATIDIDVDVGLTTGQLQAFDVDRRAGVALYDPHGLLLDTPISNTGDARVTWPKALIAGEYRLALTAPPLPARAYSFCFVVTGDTCASYGVRAIGLSAPLPTTHAEVLLVPPTQANPGGSETPLDYLDATLLGIHQWDLQLAAFATKYPQYAYLRQLEAHVEVFDGTCGISRGTDVSADASCAPERAGYDVVIVWSPYTGPIFRGVAIDETGGGLLAQLCPLGLTCPLRMTLEPYVHDGARLIVMSSFAAAPRGGQVLPDFPETTDIYNVMMHEFAHTWGLGHSTTWTATYGPDLMNSPYTFTFGDGDPAGDGGERTATQCISSVDLYGMAMLYEWVGRGVRFDQRRHYGLANLPSSVPYELYC